MADPVAPEPVETKEDVTEVEEAEIAPSEIMNILLWNNIKVSGIYFAIGLMVFALFQWYRYHAIHLVLQLATMLLFIALVYILGDTIYYTWWPRYQEYDEEQSPFEWLPRVRLTTEDVQQHVESFVSHVNGVIIMIENVFVAKNKPVTLVVFLALALLTEIAKHVPDLWLLLVVFIGVFTLPLAYKKNQELVDEHVKKVLDQVREIVDTSAKAVKKAVDSINLPPVVQRFLGLSKKKKAE